MEKKGVSPLVVMLVMIGLLVGGAQANFGKCMKKCLLQCAIPPWTDVCPASCVAKCVITGPEVKANQKFCTFGCALAACSRLITRDYYHLDEVEGCVNGCSKTCTN